MYRPNPLKQRLREGRKSFGVWLSTGNSITAEVLALAGYDFVLIDNEHGPATLPQTLVQLQAISATPAAGIVRVPWNDPVYLKRALDIGAEGVMIPAIDTPEQAEQAVRACRYPPLGFRGSAYQVVRGANYGIGAPDYPKTAAENLVVICQVESKRAVENVEAIAAVDGIDVLFVGPNDLAGTVGRFGEIGHPDVLALIDRAASAIKAAGKRLGCIPCGGLSAQDLFDRGYDMVLASTDVTLMRDAALAEVRAYRERNG
jgi:4-hydroxy-2-oxoheptanedioate aldolase